MLPLIVLPVSAWVLSTYFCFNSPKTVCGFSLIGDPSLAVGINGYVSRYWPCQVGKLSRVYPASSLHSTWDRLQINGIFFFNFPSLANSQPSLFFDNSSLCFCTVLPPPQVCQPSLLSTIFFFSFSAVCASIDCVFILLSYRAQTGFNQGLLLLCDTLVFSFSLSFLSVCLVCSAIPFQASLVHFHFLCARYCFFSPCPLCYLSGNLV